MQSTLKAVRSTEEEAAHRSTRDKLVKDHLPLVRSIAGAVRSSSVGANVPLDDLIAYGASGLLDAAERFDPDRGVPFDVFCRYRVRGAIVDGIRRHHWLPRRAYKRICAERMTGGAEPANDNGIVDPDATGRATAPAPGPVFVDVEVGGFDNGAADDSLAGHWGARWNGRRMYQSGIEPDDRLEVAARAALEELPYKERRLIELCYFEGKNLAEAGDALGMQRSWACRLHARAIAALRAALSS
jgi:RNA polymerase sigma factor for flagellar operon FliA